MADFGDKPFAPEKIAAATDDELQQMLRIPVAHRAIFKPVHAEIARREVQAVKDAADRKESREEDALAINQRSERRANWALLISLLALVVASLNALANFFKP